MPRWERRRRGLVGIKFSGSVLRGRGRWNRGCGRRGCGRWRRRRERRRIGSGWEGLGNAFAGSVGAAGAVRRRGGVRGYAPLTPDLTDGPAVSAAEQEFSAKGVDDGKTFDDLSMIQVFRVEPVAAQNPCRRDDRTVPVRKPMRFANLQCREQNGHRHILNTKSTPRSHQSDGEIMGNSVSAGAPRQLNVELLKHLYGQRTRIVVQQRDGALPL